MNRLVTAAAAVIGAGIALGALGLRGRFESQPTVSSDTLSPRAIAGGRFEPSGVAHVPESGYMLFVDDGRTREIFLMELTADRSQAGTAMPIPLGADITDMEGITSDGRHFYVVGSQSKKTGFEGDGLVRFTFDAQSRAVANVERIQALKAWLAANVPELKGTENRIGDDVLNIEGLAWDPDRQRLLIGLRAPLADGQALVVPVKLGEGGAFSRENLRLDGGVIRLPLGGGGVRSLEWDPSRKAFLAVSGASLDTENRDFGVFEWDGGSAVRQIATFPRQLKPEGFTRAVLGGRPVSVVVFDVGSFAVMD